MNLGFFPTPYPDECLYSILCRYAVRTGCTELTNIRKLLFGGQQSLASAISFPIRLDLVERWYGVDSGVTRRLIANDHALHPYMIVVYPDKFRQQFNSVVNGGVAPKTFDKTGTQRSHRLWPKYLRYCPECVRNDMVAYGETYWHRVHQLPAMLYCTKHLVRLRDSVEVVGSHMGFHPASAEPLCERNIEDDSFAPHKEKFIRIGRESEWLLRHGADIDWGFDIHVKYKRLFRDRGIATVQGVSDYGLVASAFEEHWGQDFLDSLKLELDDNREWLRQVYEAGMASFRPIYHVLLMCFLCDSVESFLNHEPQESIFGNSPWACLNPVCSHNGVDGVEAVDIRYINGIAIGFFKCTACAMVYKQLYWKKQMGQLHIVEYGDMWLNRMMHCLRDKKFDIQTTAEILKCRPSTVKWHMKKLGIFGNPEYHRNYATSLRLREAMYALRTVMPPVEPGIDFDEAINLRNASDRPRYKPKKPEMLSIYKAQVLDLHMQHEELTSAILKLHAPKAYKYLYKFDLDWLHEHMVLHADRRLQRDEDAEMLKQVQSAVAMIYSEGVPARQITPGFIAVSAGFSLTRFDYLAEKRPLTKSFIDTVVESRADWLRRRITAIAQERRAVGEKITISDVKREMSLKPNTFVKYEKFLKELMDELNG